MCYKTVYRAAYGDLTIDSQKIDDDYMRLRQMELSLTEAKVAQEIEENANKDAIDITATTTIKDEAEQPDVNNSPSQQETVFEGASEAAAAGPGF